MLSFVGNSTPVVLSDPIGDRVEEPPAGGGAPPPNVNDQLNTSPEHQPADSWEEAAVDGDPLLTPENEEVSINLLDVLMYIILVEKYVYTIRIECSRITYFFLFVTFFLNFD